MGLDVYLTAQADHEMNSAYWAAWEAEYETFEAMSPEEKSAWDAAHPQSSRAEIPSTAYPEHLFNRRYLRSSYNGGGFNRAVPEMTGTDHDLYWIFEPVRSGEEDADLTTESLDALRACRERALQVVTELKACDRLRVLSVTPVTGHSAIDADKALELVREEMKGWGGEHYKDGNWYGKRDGEFFPGGVQILAAIPGEHYGSQGVHLIWRAEAQGIDYYVQAAEITVEFCDEAIALVERDGAAHMSWSG